MMMGWCAVERWECGYFFNCLCRSCVWVGCVIVFEWLRVELLGIGVVAVIGVGPKLQLQKDWTKRKEWQRTVRRSRQ